MSHLSLLLQTEARLRAALGVYGEIESVVINSVGRYAFVAYADATSRDAALEADIGGQDGHDGLKLNAATPRAPLNKRAIAKGMAAASGAASAKVLDFIAAARVAGATAQIAAAKEARTTAQARTAAQRLRVADDLRHATVAALGEGNSVELFGSAKTLLGSSTSDVDASIITAGSVDDLKVDSWPSDTAPALAALTKVSAHMKASRMFRLVVVVPSPRCPLIKAVHIATSLQLDLTFNNHLAFRNTALLCDYIKEAPELLPQLVHATKEWASVCPAAPTSYALTLMLIRYLQTSEVVPNLQQCTLSASDAELAAVAAVAAAGAGGGGGGGGRGSAVGKDGGHDGGGYTVDKSDRPSKRQRTADDDAGAGAASEAPTASGCNTAGSLLKGFFGFVADMSWAESAISIRLCADPPRGRLRCGVVRANVGTLSDGSAVGAGAGAGAAAAEKDTDNDEAMMVVEDPYNLDHNTTAHFGSGDAHVFIGCARVARDKMLAGADFLAVLSPPIDENALNQKAEKAARQKQRRMMKKANIQATPAAASISCDLGRVGVETVLPILAKMGIPSVTAVVAKGDDDRGSFECSVMQNSWVGARQRRRAAQRAAAAGTAAAAEGDGSAPSITPATAPGGGMATAPAAAPAAPAASSKPLFKLLLQSNHASDLANLDAGGTTEPTACGPKLVMELCDVEDRQTAQQFVALFKKKILNVAKA